MIEDLLVTPDIVKIRKLRKYSSEFKKISKLIVTFYKNNKNLILASEKAEKANRLKTSFLSNMSHEIRTPLNGIIGFSEQLINSDESNERRKLYIKFLKKSSDDLLNSINGILDISLIETGALKVCKKNFMVNDLIFELEEKFKIKIQEEKPDLEFRLAEIQDCSQTIYTDKNLLYKVMYHLIENAWKFTEKGYIEIGWYRNTSETIFYVKDSGIGIAHSQQEYIYDFFRQADDSITRSYGGNGIGLSICRGIVKALGGEIWLKSELGKGATFYFSVPILLV